MEALFELERFGFGPESLGIPENFRAQFISLMEPHFELALKNMEGEITSRVPFGATGDLGRSIHGVVVPHVADLIGVVRAEGDAEEYAYFVEYGRAAGKMPPWSEEGYNGKPGIFPWVEHVVTSGAHSTTGKVTPKSQSRDEEVEEASFLIARAIGEHGVKGRHPFEEGWTASQPMALVILNDGLSKILPVLWAAGMSSGGNA